MAGNNIKGIIVEIGGNTGPLNEALKGVNKTSYDLQSELKLVNNQLKFSPDSAVLLEQKQELLAKSITNSKEKLLTLKTAEEQAQQQFARGDISAENYRALQREVIKTENQLENLESQAIRSNAVLSKDEAVGNLKNMAKAAGVAALAVGAGLVAVGAAALTSADELQRQSDVTGLSAERLQELTYAGNNLGVELDVITGAQAKLTKSMDAAKGGTGAQSEAFKTLGINVLDGNGHLKNASDVMNETFSALGKVGNETERDALSMKLFGKSAMEMNPMIKAGGDELKKLSEEAKKNGSVMSNEAVAGLDTFGDTIDNLKSAVLGSVGESLAKLMPSIQGILDKIMVFPQFIKENSATLTILAIIIGTITALVIAFNIQQALLASGMTIWGFVAGIGTTITTGLGTAFTFLLSPIALVIIAIVAIIAIFVLAYKNIDGFRNIVDKSWAFIQTKTKEVFEGYIMPFIRDQLMPLFQKVFATIGDVVKGAFVLIGWAWNFVLKPIFIVLLFYIQNILIPAWKLAFSVVGGVVKAIFGTIGDLWNKSLKPIFNGILDFISGVFTGNWSKAWHGVVSIFKGVWEGMKTIAKAPINFIIGGLNGFINGINKIQIPDWVPGVGGKGINIPHIPSFSVGTRFLPQDMLIQAHAGEMIIPKSENPYANSGGRITPDANNKAPVTLQLVLQNGKAIAEFIVDDLEGLMGNKNKISGRSLGLS